MHTCIWANRAPKIRFRCYDANLYCRRIAQSNLKANPLCRLMGVHPPQHDVVSLCSSGDSHRGSSPMIRVAL